MKTYFECLNEINDEELYEGLLAYGLFSEMLPPIFTSEKFYKYCKTKTIDLSTTKNQYIRYDSMRNINIPREIGIPNPFAYENLCRNIKDNWEKIKQHFKEKTKNEKYKVSRIHVRKMKDTKKLFVMNYDNWFTDGTPEVDLLQSNKYVVHVDISSCFDSIYSHAIPWALVGKADAKKSADDKTLWYNKLDSQVQKCKYGETDGILIGPHASNVLSEIVLTSIDCVMSKNWNYIRNIDDYSCYVKTKDDALKFIIEVGSELKKYNLSLNHKKTEILELPISIVGHWKHKLDNLEIYYRKEHFDFKSIQAYLDLAVNLMKENNNNAAILNYAIKCIPQKDMSDNAKIFCVKYLLHLCLMYPYLLRIMDEYVFKKFSVDVSIIQEFSNSVYSQSILNKNYDGICYALYFALKHNFKIDGIKATHAIESENCIFCLMSYIYFNKNGLAEERKELHKFAVSLEKSDDDFNQNWLFVYEVLTKDELNGDRSEWRSLKKQGNISFLRSEFKV